MGRKENTGISKLREADRLYGSGIGPLSLCGSCGGAGGLGWADLRHVHPISGQCGRYDFPDRGHIAVFLFYSKKGL